ncbi:serine O-acetyltransferase [Fundicoccus sp. Sow4_F4]|uniref:serine O-acetyltransferase n=1 Tax=Fundicoccus sp. Sow4_F4 TaxID=3438783 RepID=UPI003F91B263
MKDSRLLKDLKNYSNGSFFKMIYTVLLNPNFHAVMNYRVANYLKKWTVFLPIVKLIMYLNRVLFSVDIDYRANLAGGFVLIHGMGVVIGKDVITESNVKVYQSVTLGGNGKKREYNSLILTQPLIRKNVIIYSNSTIVGPCIIGENSIVGANSLILKDVKNNTTVYTKSVLSEITK